MTSYNFKTREFAVSDVGIHLLRSGYNYQTVPFSHIKQIIIEKGKETPNWIGVFLLGTAILYAAVDFSMISIDNFVYGNAGAGHAKLLVFLLLLGCAGGTFVHSSLRHGVIVRIIYGSGKHDRFPLKEIIDQGKFGDLLFMLQSKLDSRRTVKLKKSTCSP